MGRLCYVLCCVFVLFVSVVCVAPLQAAPAEKEDKTFSPYFWVKSDDPEIDRLPLKSTDVNVSVSGVVADVTVTQVYNNEGTRPIEAVYVFPASIKAAVYGMKMQIDERIIVAEVKEREEAQKTYEQAKEAGQSASLLEQKRPNVFQMNVANILPEDVVKIELKYTELLVPTDAVYQFIYPTVVGPRYVGGEKETGPPDTWTATPFLHEGEPPTSTFHIVVNLHAGLPLHDVSCTSHKVNINFIGKTDAVIDLDSAEKHGGNRDYILRYRLAGDRIETGILLYEGERENFFLLMMQPPKRIKPSYILPRDYMFIVDVSGSMNGFPMEISKQLLSDLIGKLSPVDRFNVLLFAGGSTVMSPESVPATPENIEGAIKTINSRQGSGSTNLLPALEKAFLMPGAGGYSRNIIIATDGYVHVELEAFDLIRRKLGEANVFTFGIGTSVNRYLIEGLARVGQGEPFVATGLEQAEEKAEEFRKVVESPVLTGIIVDYNGFDAYDIEPLSIPDVMAERPVLIFGKYRGKPTGTIRLLGRAGGMTYEHVFDTDRIKPSPDHSALRYLWARNRIALLVDYILFKADDQRKEEVTSLGLTYNLLTPFTSFVAVDYQQRLVDGKTVTVKQPLPLPAGVSDYSIDGLSMTGRIPFRGAVHSTSVHASASTAMIHPDIVTVLPLSRNAYGTLKLDAGISTNIDAAAEIFSALGSFKVTSRGLAGWNNNTWFLDDIDITDPAEPGTPAAHFDMDSLDEIDVDVGGGDISNQTGAVKVNYITRGGGNRHHFDVRYFLADDAFAAKRNENSTEQWGMRNANKIDEISDYGVTAGGPIRLDVCWYWFSIASVRSKSYPRADVDTLSPVTLRTYDFKLDWRTALNNHLKLSLHAENYKGRADNVRPESPMGFLRENLHSFGNPIFRIHDDYIVNDNLIVKLKYAYISSGFRALPVVDPDYEYMIRLDEATGVMDTSYGRYYKNRKKHSFSAQIIYFNDGFLGFDHEVNLFGEYGVSRTNDEQRTPGPAFAPSEAFMTYNWATSQFNVDGLPGDDVPVGWEKLSIGRHSKDIRARLKKISLGFQDTVSKDRLTLELGLRYDRYLPSLDAFSAAALTDEEKELPRYSDCFDKEVLDLIGQWIPPMDVPAHNGKGYAVSIFSPRLGVIWDINGNGKNMVKLSAGLYGDVQGTGNAGYLLPYGVESGLQFWLQRDTPGKYTLNDLYWTDYATGTPVPLFTGTTGTWQERLNPALSWDQLLGYNAGPSLSAMFYGFTPGTGTPLPSRYEIDKNAWTSKRFDAVLSFEREIEDRIYAGITLYYARHYHFAWECDWFKNGDGAVINAPRYYEAAGTVPGSIDGIPQYNPGDAEGREWYVLKPTYRCNPDGYKKIERWPDYYREYKAIDLMLTKRFSNKWKMDGTVTFKDTRQHFGEAGFLNRTNLWAVDGKPYASMLNSASSRWVVRLSGYYVLPLDIRVAALFYAREGNMFLESFSIKDERPTTGPVRSGDILMYQVGKKRLPAYYQLDLRLEKRFKLSDKVKLDLMVDCFNVFNNLQRITRNNRNHGALVIKPDGSYSWEPNTNPWTNGEVTRVSNPRIFRLGARLSF